MTNFQQKKRNLSFFLLEMEAKSSALKIWHQGSSLFSAEYREFWANSAQSITFRSFHVRLSKTHGTDGIEENAAIIDASSIK